MAFSIRKLAMLAVRIKSANKMEEFLSKALKVAYAEGAGAHIVDDSKEIYYRVPKETKFECLCPECKALLEIDLSELVEIRPILKAD